MKPNILALETLPVGDLIGGSIRLCWCAAVLCACWTNGFVAKHRAFAQETQDSAARYIQTSSDRTAILANDEVTIFETPYFADCPTVDSGSASDATAEVQCGAKSTPPKDRIPLHAYWNHGFWVASDADDFNLHVGGDLHWDSVWLNGSDSVLGVPSSNANSTTNSGASLLRRARIKLEGKFYEQFDYALEYDLANAANDNAGLESPTQSNLASSPIPRNVWVQRRDLPFFGSVCIGNQVKPVGMDRNTSHKFLPFMERSDNMDGLYGPFDGGYLPGISATNWTESERITWRYGLYRPLLNAYGVGINGYQLCGRASALPVYQNGGAQLIHVGFSMAQGSLLNDEFRLRARPLLRNGPGYAIPVVVDTSTLPGKNQFLLGPELAGVLGRWTYQAEWTGQFHSDAVAANGQGQGTVFFQGGYAQVLYFLTGEHQAYDKHRGSFTRVVPLNPVRRASGLGGAWQVGARFSYLNLTDKAIDGGQIADMTIGLNWFLNSNLKIQGNYLLASRQGQQGQGDGWFNGLGMRVACDF